VDRQELTPKALPFAIKAEAFESSFLISCLFSTYPGQPLMKKSMFPVFHHSAKRILGIRWLDK
jgi:hypothetical protein